MNLAIFDIDGTLTVSTGVDDACLVEAWERVLGVRVADTDWANYTHSTDEGLAVEVAVRYRGTPATRAEIDRVKHQFVDLLGRRLRTDASLCRPVPGAVAMLERLRREPGWTVGIATGSWPESARVKLAAAGIDIGGLPASFSRALSTGAAATREQIIDGTREQAGSLHRPGHPFRTVYIGDGVWDARASRNLDIGFVGIRVGGDFERLRDEGAQRLFADYAEPDRFMVALSESAR